MVTSSNTSPAGVMPRVLLATHGSDTTIGDVSNYLQQQWCTVVWCDSTREAAVQAAVLMPHLVILSGPSLPDVLDSCRVMRAITPAFIVVIGNQHAEADEVLCLESGSDGYLALPSSARRIGANLSAMLRRAVGPAQSKPSPVVRFGSISIDTYRRRVYRDGNVLELSQKEYRLLLFLVEHAGQAVTRRSLAHFVWGVDARSDSRSLDVHIHWLREKLENNARNPRHIRTIRGVGYCLEVQPDPEEGTKREVSA